MERGYIRVRASDGSYPYEEFQIDSSEDLYFHLTETLDGTVTNLDVSAGSAKVYLRAKVEAATGDPPVNVEATKRTGTTTAGDTGKVKATLVLRAADFVADDVAVLGVYVVDQTVADTLTFSGYKETLWRGLWRARVRETIDA
jgi:hypothetical protein